MVLQGNKVVNFKFLFFDFVFDFDENDDYVLKKCSFSVERVFIKTR